MIIRCIHLRAIGVIEHPCCDHCHGPAGCVVHSLPDGHRAIYCCARTDPFTPAEIESILANIPRWQAIQSNPRYHSQLRLEYKKVQSRLRRLEDLMADAGIKPDNEERKED